ncbi:hypothetical protein TARUN_7534 [Trichoderma arundinaceum]|uniref:Uncharacterized protein n=1 Tax=Trichoderma arundinaceum TaxID=490622 RepID=A0A395NG22_TRIAR|nr:hypothetical protein TARUN_7534 [Trichoderma arundinaceum]
MSAVDRVVRLPLPLPQVLHNANYYYVVFLNPRGTPLRILCVSVAIDIWLTRALPVGLALNIEKSAKCSHCVAGHHKCEDLLVDKDGKIKPAARAVAAASLRVSRGEEVPEYEDLATKYNLLARREAKRRTPSASGVTSAAAAAAAAAAVSTEALAELIRRQNEILLDIRAELSAMRERSGAGTPPVEDSDVYEDDYGLDPELDNEAED